ncbi:MAG: flagellar hook-basal body complex protein, partial [Legionella sp.]
MSSTYYTSLSGMMVASYGLQNTSNNVANMQSPGFKRSDVFYSSLGNGSGEEGLGCGVKVSGSSTNFTDGKYLETNNPSDLAIIGQGFFVVRMKTGELLYTRAGEFAFNNDGVLIDRRSGGEVQGYNSAGNLVAIHEKGPKTSAGKASRELFLNGQFVLLEQTEDEKKGQIGNLKNKYKNIKFEVAKVY